MSIYDGRTEALLNTGALQSAIFNSAKFSSIATDAKGVIQIFNVGADQHFYTPSLIESNIDALMAIDPCGIITDVNKQTEALTGCTRDELIGRHSRTTSPIRAGRRRPSTGC
jgi:PAS domain-containing protein